MMKTTICNETPGVSLCCEAKSKKYHSRVRYLLIK